MLQCYPACSPRYVALLAGFYFQEDTADDSSQNIQSLQSPLDTVNHFIADGDRI